MTGWRVAVAPGATAVRLAGHDPGNPSDGGPRLIAEAPASVAPADLLADLLSGPPVELLWVHPTGRHPAPPHGLAPRVRPVPAAVAAAWDVTGPVVVVDAGHTGTEISLLRPDVPPMVRRTGVGGALLDQVTRSLLGDRVTLVQARRAREALSLLPEVHLTDRRGHRLRLRATTLRTVLARELEPIVDAVRSVLVADDAVDPPIPVRLVGGLARTPLLAELFDAAGIAPVDVAPRPEVAAVLGALRLPSEEPAPVPPRPVAVSYLPSPRSRSGIRLALVGCCVVGAAAAVAASAATDPAPPPEQRRIVQYGYSAAVPDGWVHSGGLPERRRSLLTPIDAPRGADVVAIEQTPLGYDSAAEPDRARAELRARFDAAVAAGEPLTDFDPDAEFAGRAVVTYRQADDHPVDWYVVFEGDSQLSVGCRATPARRAMVDAACATVVASLRRTG